VEPPAHTTTGTTNTDTTSTTPTSTTPTSCDPIGGTSASTAYTASSGTSPLLADAPVHLKL
jgi:hypothetical protein